MSSKIQQSITNKARADKFSLVLTIPQILKDINAQLLSARSNNTIQQDALQFAVWGVVVPSVNIPEQETRLWGQPYKVTSQAREAYSPVSVDFTIDNNYNNYWVLWKWMEFINDPRHSGMDEHFGEYAAGEDEDIHTAVEKSEEIGKSLQKNKKNTNPSRTMKHQSVHMVNNYLDYQTTITIFGLDEYNIKTVQFNYYNAFITQLGEIRYNFRDPTELESSFQFNFSQMDIVLLDKQSGGPAE